MSEGDRRHEKEKGAIQIKTEPTELLSSALGFIFFVMRELSNTEKDGIIS
jgi:hypothetical protein